MTQYYGNLQDFIKVLEAEGELVRIQTPVSRDLEISEIYFRQIRSPGGGKALLFENVEGSDLPVLINAYGSDKRLELSLNRNRTKASSGMLVEIASELRELMKLLQLKPPATLGAFAALAGQANRILKFPPKKKRFGKAACQEIVWTGDQVDLDALPILKSWPLDGGRFITFGMTLTRSLDGGTKNLGLYRIQILDKKTAIMHWQIHKDGSHFFGQYRKAKQRMPVAVVFGGDPSIPFSAIAPLPPGLYELLMAGFVRGSGVPVVKCKTNDLEVPADAEIILEGYVDPDDFAQEGPFGDHTGYYTPVEPFPRFHITAITMRKGAVFPATVVGRSPQEDCYLARAVERLFLPMLSFIAPEVKDQMLPWDGCFHNCAVLAMEKTFPFQGRKLMSHLWGFSQMSFSKMLIVVDASVDLHLDQPALLAYILDRLDLETDLMITEGVLDQLDHSGIRPLFGGKLGIDVTTKTPEEKSASTPIRYAASGKRDEIVSAWKAKLELAGIKVVNSHLFARELRNPVLILAIDKGNTGKLPDRIAETLRLEGEAELPCTILLLIDAKDSPTNASLVLWKMFGNTDVLRDLKLIANKTAGTIAILDATSKNSADGYDRAWPEENLMDDATIKLVDSKWKAMFGVDPFPVERP